MLATGRPPRWIHPVVEGLGYAPLAVCANGAVIYDSDSDRVLSAATLDVDTLTWLSEIALRVLPGAGLAAERVGVSAHDAATPQFVSSPATSTPGSTPTTPRCPRTRSSRPPR